MRTRDIIEAARNSEWQDHYISYLKLKKLLDLSDTIYGSVDDYENKVLQENLRLQKCEFFNAVQKEFNKVENFFVGRLLDSTNRFKIIQNGIDSIKFIAKNPYKVNDLKEMNSKNQKKNFLDILGNRKRNLGPQPIGKIFKLEKNYEKAWENLKEITAEYYLFLYHLMKFKTINYIAFKKILRVFDKIYLTNEGDVLMQTVVEKSQFVNNTETQEKILAVEAIYINVLNHGQKAKSIKELEIPPYDYDKPKINLKTLLLGAFILGCILELILILWNITHNDLPFDHKPAIIMFSGQLMLILNILFLSWNMIIWSRNGINLSLILEIDPRHHINYLDFLLMGFFLLFIWETFVFLYVNYDLFNLHLHLFPIISYLIFIVLFFFPFNLFYLPSRKWLGILILRNLVSPFFKVTMADLFIFDQLISLAQPLNDLFSYTPCVMAETFSTHDYDYCESQSFYLNLIISTAPFYYRGMLCFRRFYDIFRTGNTDYVNIFNGFKCWSFVLHQIFFAFYSFLPFKSKVLFWVTYGVRIFSLLYFFFCDTWVDWGLFGPVIFKKGIIFGFTIRSRRLFAHKIYYFIAFFANFLLRLLSLIPPITFLFLFTKNPYASTLIRCSINAIEVWRRCMWNIFRMEFEQIINIYRTRVIRELPVNRFPSYQVEIDKMRNNPQLIHEISQSAESLLAKRVNHNNMKSHSKESNNISKSCDTKARKKDFVKISLDDHLISYSRNFQEEDFLKSNDLAEKDI